MKDDDGGIVIKMNRKRIIVTIIIVLILVLWISNIIPKQIAKIYGITYMNNHFPKMKLEYRDLWWNQYYDSYMITFKSEDNNTYSCCIGPKYFPVFWGQGLFVIEDTYRVNY